MGEEGEALFSGYITAKLFFSRFCRKCDKSLINLEFATAFVSQSMVADSCCKRCKFRKHFDFFISVYHAVNDLTDRLL